MPDLRPAAVLFDFDGTLVDTEPYWMRSEMDLLGAYHVPWSIEQAIDLCGTSKENSIEVLFAQMASHGVDVSHLDPEQFYDELSQNVIDSIHKWGAPWLPGVQSLLIELAASHVPCAVVSASPANVLEAGVAAFPSGAISVVIDGQSTKAGKPEPDCYLLAAERLGVDITDCVVVEDTLAGTTAGLAAGAGVIAVPRAYSLADREGMVVLPNLEGIDATRLFQLFTQVKRS